MRTRNSYFPNNSPVTIPRRRNRRRTPNVVEPELRTIVEVAPMADNRTMEELLQAPTEGYGEAIVIPEINADHFEIKTNLLQLVQANPFHGFERENPHTHINNFKRITSTLKFRDVPNDVIKLMMFPYSLEGAARVWYDKEPPNSILTWEDLVTKFVNQFFPPSKTTHLKNEISCFTQKFEETFSEAWERFKEMLRACPHHGFTELTQIDTFYNGLNENDQDSLNAAAGENLLIVHSKVVTPAPVKAVEETCVTCGGAHSWYNCPTTDNNQASVCATTGTYNQVNPPNRVSNQMAPPGFAPVQNNGQNRFNQNQVQGNNFNRGNNFHGNQGFQAQNNHAPNFQNQGFQNQPFQVPNNQVQQEFSNDFSSYKRNNDQMMRNMQNQINSLKGDLKNEIQNTIKSQQAVMMNQQTTFQNNLQNMICGLFQNQASTSGTLPSNTIPNPKGEMKAITTRSGVAYEGPSIPTNPSPKKVVERETEETTDKEQTNFQGSTAQIPPPVIPISIPEPDIPKSLPKPNIPYPSRRDDQKSRDKASNQMEKIFQIFQDLRFDISFACLPFDCQDLLLKIRDSFKKFTDEPALVCLPPSEDDNDEKEKQEVKNLAEPTAKRQTQSEDTSRSDSKNVLPSCDDFSSINVPRDDSVTFSNPLFEFDVNFNSSDINPLFDEVLEDIECKDSYDSNLDESTFLVTPLSDSNKDDVLSILEGFIDDPLFEENDDLFDLECKTNDWKRILYDAPIDKAECFDPGGDNDEIDAFLAIEVPTYIEEGYYDSEGDVLYLESLLSDDNTHNLSSDVFFDHEPQHIKNESDHDTLITFSPKSDPLHHEFAGEVITIPPGIEDIDIFSGPDDSIPPGIESDIDSEEDIIDNLLNDDPIPEFERLTFDMEPDVPVINNVYELNEDECFDPGGGEINVKVDDSFTFPEVSPLLSSTENEDTIFDPGIST
ncbi:reverse transcriptase domain-containing protein [Tanacetum coccineum]